MKNFEIVNAKSGTSMGIWSAISAEAALSMYAIDAGCQSFADACNVADGSDIEAREAETIELSGGIEVLRKTVEELAPNGESGDARIVFCSAKTTDWATVFFFRTNGGNEPLVEDAEETAALIDGWDVELLVGCVRGSGAIGSDEEWAIDALRAAEAYASSQDD